MDKGRSIVSYHLKHQTDKTVRGINPAVPRTKAQ